MLSAACAVSAAKIKTSAVIEIRLLMTFSFMALFVLIQFLRSLELDLHLINLSGKGKRATVKVVKRHR